MHKKNKKGFTLIEILAVFVVLAILALIAVPTISSVINDSQKSSFKTGMKNIRDAARFYVQRASLDEEAEEDFCVYFSFDNDVPEVVQIEVDGELRTYAPVSHLELKGALPTSGEVKACTDMIELNVCNDHFCGNSTDTEDNVTDGDLSEADTSTPVINQIIVTKKTTSSIEIAVDAYNPNKFGKIATYYYSLDGKNYVESTNNSYAFTDLNYNTEYLIYVKVENKAGKVSEKSVKITTGTFDEISFTVTPKEWSYNKNVVINGETAGATLQYRITKYDSDGNLAATEWTTYNGIIYLDTMATVTKPTTIYARFVDGINTSGEKTYVVTTIDTTDPSIISRGVSTTTKSIEIEFAASDSESGIKKTICEYGENYSEQGTVSGNKCIINDVSSNTSYDYRIITTNNAGLTGELKGKATTIDFPEIGITVTPDGWTNKKTVVLSGTIEGAKLEYKIRRYNEITLEIEETAFTEYNEPIILDTFANAAYPTTIIAQFNDDVNISKQKSVLVTSIDTDKPNINITGLQTTTQSITLLYTLSDSTSSVADYTCVYGISQSYGSTGTSTESSCFLSNLDKGKTYYYKITATDIAGNDAVYESSVATGTTNVLFDISQTPSGTVYAKSKKLTINYIVDKVSNPSYYFKATTSATTESEVYDCGSEEVPGACSSNGTTDIVAGTWYHTKSATLITNFTSNGTVYAVINDGDSYLTASTFVIDKIDTTGPSTTAPSATAVSTAPTSQVTITNNQTDAESGVASVKYGIATSAAGTYTYQTSATFTGLTAGTTYYFKTQSTNGVGITTTSSYVSYAPGKGNGSCTVSQDTTNWTTSKTMTVTSSSAPAGTTLQYKIGSSGTWTAITSGNTFTLTANNVVYCQLYDGVSTVASNQLSVTKIDTTGPSTTKPAAAAVSTAPTSQVKITNNQTDAESDIASVKYGKATSATGTYTYQTSATFTGLTAGTTYYFKTQSTNGVGITTTSEYTSYTPSKSGSCTVSQNTSSWTTSKTIAVTSSSAPAGTTLQYKIGSSGTWTAITSGNTFTLTANNIVYCQLYDGVSTVASNQLSVTKIDTTSPTVTLGTTSTTTNSIDISYTLSDSQSGIGSYTCKYMKYETHVATAYDDSRAGNASNTTSTKCTLTGLTENSTYYYRVCATDNAGNTTTCENGSATTKKAVTYTVKHYTMNTDMSTYNLAYAESLTGAAGDKVTPSVKTYTGFNSPSKQTVTVAADGSTVVEYKYTRKQITVTFYRNTSSSDTSTASQTFTYGVSGNKFGYNTNWVNSGQFGSWNRTGYALSGWATSPTATSATYGKNSDVDDAWLNSHAPSIKLYAVWVKDTTPPTCTITGTSTTCAKSRTLTATCKDSQSGCTSDTASSTFTFSSTELTKVTSSAAQSYTIKDNAGNSATCSTEGYNVYVDPIAPKAYINGKLSSSGTTYYSLINGSANWTNQNVYMWGRSENSGCAAVSYYQYSTDGTNYTKTTSKPEHTFEKTGTFYIKVTDTLGNTSSASTRAYIDRTAPTATLTVTPDNGDNKFKISVTSTDSQSGIKSTTVTYGKRSSSGACSYASTAYTASGYYWTSNSLSSGTYCFKVTVTDNVGNYITKTTTSSVS